MVLYCAQCNVHVTTFQCCYLARKSLTGTKQPMKTRARALCLAAVHHAAASDVRNPSHHQQLQQGVPLHSWKSGIAEGRLPAVLEAWDVQFASLALHAGACIGLAATMAAAIQAPCNGNVSQLLFACLTTTCSC